MHSKTDGVSNTLNTLRGDPFTTFAFAPRGGGVKEVANFANDSTDRLRETANKGGEGVQNPENFANVINGCPLIRSAGIAGLRTGILAMTLALLFCVVRSEAIKRRHEL